LLGLVRDPAQGLVERAVVEQRSVPRASSRPKRRSRARIGGGWHGALSSVFRTVKSGTALLRRVTVGAKGTITFLISIHLGGSSPETWKITSATRAYKRLHGHGRQVVDKFDETPARFVLQGTVSQ
jgi:hypothetical protein